MFPELTGFQRFRVLGGLGLITGLLVGPVAAVLYVYFRAFGGLDGLSGPLIHQSWSLATAETLAGALYVGGGLFLAAFIGGIALAATKPDTTYGAARFAKPSEAARTAYARRITPGKDTDAEIVFGKFGKPAKKNALYVKTAVEPHAFIGAPTGKGKGVSIVIPNLLHFNGSMVCLDVAGENFRKTAVHRQKHGDKIIRFAPGDPDRTHCFNPLAVVARLPDPDDQYEELAALADSFITSTPGVEGWIKGCKDLFTCTGMLALERGDATIGKIFDMLVDGSPAKFKKFAKECKYPLAKTRLKGFGREEQKRLNDYISILNDHGLGAWSRPSVRRVTSRNDIDVHSLRRVPTTIYLDCPEDKLKRNAPLIRLLFQQISNALHASQPGPDEPFQVLFLLDEFDSLGRMEPMIDGYRTLRKHGGRLMIITQNISQLYDLYGVHTVKGFVSNAGTRVVSATADLELARLISETIGDKTYKSTSVTKQMGAGLDLFATGKSHNVHAEGIALVKPQDITNLDPAKFLLVRGEGAPIVMHKIRYFEDAYFQEVFEAQAGTGLPYPETGAPKVADGIAVEVEKKTRGLSSQGDLFDAPEVAEMDEDALAALLAESEDLEGAPVPTQRMNAGASGCDVADEGDPVSDKDR